MVRLAHERVLLIGDPYRQVHAALAQALPGAHVTSVTSYFEGVAELVANRYTAVVAATEPIERRPEAAVSRLRELIGDEGRVVLFAHPTMELLSRKMLEFGVDDYVITPANSGEIEQIFRSPVVKRARPAEALAPVHEVPTSPLWPGSGALAEILLDGLITSSRDPVGAAVKRLAQHMPGGLGLVYDAAGGQATEAPAGTSVFSEPVHVDKHEVGQLCVLLAHPRDDEPLLRDAFAQLARLLSKLGGVGDLHNTLHQLAVTDELTGLFNARYFRHFLAKIIDRAKHEHFPVTLLLFDIDDFKHYNDQYGHGVGDEILRQTAALMRQCTREHDRVCRIGGDEFAVVFWDKEGPRKPRDPATPATPYRPPQSPEQIFNRFKRLIADEKFPVLGPTGQGVLGISAGMAVYPYEAQDAASLIREADNRLMHGAKKRGKNSLVIVGTDEIFPTGEVKP